MSERKKFKSAERKKQPDVILGKGGVSAAGWHKIESFLRCPKAYQYSQVRGIRTPATQTPDHFAIGIIHHAMRARWFSLRFADDAKTWTQLKLAAQEAAEEQELPVSADAIRKTESMFRLYMNHWLMRPRPDPLAAEYLVGPSPIFEGDPETARTARLDDVSRYPEAGGKLCLGESKTTSTSIGDTVNQYTLHGQPLLQALLWKHSPQGEAMHGPIAGIMLDIFKKPYEKQKPDFGRVFVPLNERVLDWYARSMAGYLRAAGKVDWDTEVPRNVQGCTYMAGRMRVTCEFRDLCLHGRSATGSYVLRDGSSLLAHKPEAGKEKMPWE